MNQTAKLNQSEALFGFMGWLTTQDIDLLIGSKHDAAPIVDLLSMFIDENDLPDIRDDWTVNLKHPEQELKL